MVRINYENPDLKGSLETKQFISRLNKDPRIKSITFGEGKVRVDIGEIETGQSLMVFSVSGKNLKDPAVVSFLGLFDEGHVSYNIEGMGENSSFIGVRFSFEESPPIKFRTRFLEPDGGIKQGETPRPVSGGSQLSVDTTVSVGEMKDDMEVIVKGGSVIFEKRGE